jgi:hypothetical protein
MLPHIRVSAHDLADAPELFPPGPRSFEDRDNFVRNLVTILTGGAWGFNSAPPENWPETPLTPSAVGRAPVLTLLEVKMHLRIEPDVTVEDEYLAGLEMAARLHAENILRRQIDASVGENVKWAIKFLIAHFYRNREAVAEGTMNPVPLAVESLLAPERDYPPGVI